VAESVSDIPIMEAGKESRKTCGARLCLVSFVWCGRLITKVSPLSLLPSYLVRLSASTVLSDPFPSGALFLRRVISHVRQGGGGRLPPLFVFLSTLALVQAYYLLDCVACCCQPIPRIFDMGLLGKVDFPVSHRI